MLGKVGWQCYQITAASWSGNTCQPTITQPIKLAWYSLKKSAGSINIFSLIYYRPNVWVSKNQSNLASIFSLWLLLSFFWYILISYRKAIMPRSLKWGILGASTIILSENIHKNAGKATLNFADSHARIEEKDRQTQLLCYVSLIRACNKVL